MGRVMRGAGRTRARIDAGERGAALIEAAILMPVVLLIVFGAIEFSSLFKDAATLSSAARSGGRTASAEPRNTNMPGDTAAAVSAALSNLPATAPSELWVYDATNSTAKPNACGGSSCALFTWNSTTRTFTGSYNSSWVQNQNVCGANGTWARVGIWVQASHPFVTKLFGASKTITASAIFRMEPLPSGQCAQSEES